jgi:2-deoxy-D-gluconate 3-dehydrogenase
VTRQSIAELFDLTGRAAIVTGGGSGIGRAIAVRLAEAGAAVMATDINIEAADTTVDRIRGAGGEARAIQADAGCVADAEMVAKAAIDAFGRLDILVNNAGIFPHSPMLDITEELWDRVFSVNLKGVFFYSQAAVRHMINLGNGGNIVNISSMEGLHPREDLAHYVTSKGALVTLTNALALELARHDIRVNAVAPGGIGTPGIAAQSEALMSRGRTGEDIKEMFRAFLSRLPLGRMGEPDDVARVVLFLVSPASAYMTGSLILADGGYLLT